ncbi:MAG: tetratricopeptide repeat protein [Pirellulaceae bacterium]|nr:tetratricopeptide repeat protein [Pirellulaceae bacterium]
MPLAVAQSELALADEVYAGGDLGAYKRSAGMYAKISDGTPKDYEAAWKAARAYRQYASYSKEQDVDDWETICREYGKQGMKYGERAIANNPKGVEGYFWYGCAVGNYSDGVSIATALSEGLKGKTQANLEKAYEIDKTYRDGGPIKAIGRFWYVLPWPLTDKKRSLEYLREMQQLYPDDPEGQVFLGELLIDMKEKAEAKKLLEKAARSENSYYANEAKRLLAKVN